MVVAPLQRRAALTVLLCWPGLQEDGSPWWGNIPKGLYNKVNGRLGGQPDRADIDYVALGPSDYYFVQFKDGGYWVDGPASLMEELHSSTQDSDVELLAFGPNDSWYVLYDDGAWAWEGIPAGLRNQVGH